MIKDIYFLGFQMQDFLMKCVNFLNLEVKLLSMFTVKIGKLFFIHDYGSGLLQKEYQIKSY